ncbi:MAG: hypothetical protein RIS69_1497 [Actinomycetota bacterium]
MPEAVIVATARSPIGRANKGSLVSLRTDEMAAQIVRALMAKVPSVKGSDIEDLIIAWDAWLRCWPEFPKRLALS